MDTTEDIRRWALSQRGESDPERNGLRYLVSACERYSGDLPALSDWLRDQVAIEYGHVYEQEVYHVVLRSLPGGGSEGGRGSE
jgi:hypothetical protein